MNRYLNLVGLIVLIFSLKSVLAAGHEQSEVLEFIDRVGIPSFGEQSDAANLYSQGDYDDDYLLVEVGVEDYKLLSKAVLGGVWFKNTESESEFNNMLSSFYSIALNLEAMLTLPSNAEVSELAKFFFQSLDTYQTKIHILLNSESLNIEKSELGEFRVKISSHLQAVQAKLKEMLHNWDEIEL